MATAPVSKTGEAKALVSSTLTPSVSDSFLISLYNPANAEI